MTKTILTIEGKRKLQEELNYLTSVEKPRAIIDLADARDRGTEENFEYEAAREECNRLQNKIAKLTETLSNSVIVNSLEVDISHVSIFSTVRVLNNGKEIKFTIVPDNEVDIKSRKISANSPIGSGLLNKKIGEKSKIQTPSGIIELEILEISL